MTPIIWSFHWLKASDCTASKLSTLTYSTVIFILDTFSNSHPLYSHMTTLSIFWHQASFNPTKTKVYGQRYFFYQVPSTWKKLSVSLHCADSSTTFKSAFKMYFSRNWWLHPSMSRCQRNMCLLHNYVYGWQRVFKLIC